MFRVGTCAQNTDRILQLEFIQDMEVSPLIFLDKADDMVYTAVSSEAWAKLRDWASVAGRGRLLLSGSGAHASLKTAVLGFAPHF